MPPTPPATFHLSVKLIGDDGDGRYLLLRRSAASRNHPGLWELPGGKVDPGESFDAALLREVREETGLPVTLTDVAGHAASRIDDREIAYVIMAGRFASKSVTLSDEHDEYGWFELGRMVELGDELCPQFAAFVREFGRRNGYGPRPKSTPAAPTTPAVEAMQRVLRTYAERRHHFEALGERIAGQLRKATARLCPLAQVSSRSKTLASFVDKIGRKNYADPLHDMTDLCGVRVVAHLRSEVEAICAFVRQTFAVDEKHSADTLDRLRPDQFGYRSVHYVVRLRPEQLGVGEGDLAGLAAEIQVRTSLQHVWSDIGHDRLYKGLPKVPRAWEREAARIAAILENADDAFGALVREIEGFGSSHGPATRSGDDALLTTMVDDVRRLGRPDEHVPLAERLALQLLGADPGDGARIARLLKCIDGTSTPLIDFCRGAQLVRRHGGQPSAADLEAGRQALRRAAADRPREAAIPLALARSFDDGDERLRALRAAVAADPADPEALLQFAFASFRGGFDEGLVALLRPNLDRAIDRCRLLIEAGVEVQAALYRIGRCQMLLGDTAAALSTLTRALQRSPTDRTQLRAAIAEAAALRLAAPGRTDLVDVVRLLWIGCHVRLGDSDAADAVGALAAGRQQLARPVVILAGDCDPAATERIERHRELLLRAFERFRGAVLGGGTTAGIAGLAGELGAASGDRIRTVGYAPQELPKGGHDELDRRYHAHRRSDGRGFSVREPLQYWIDLLAEGVSPADVRVLGVGGGRIAAFEYQLAWALGARVAVVRGSGGAVTPLEGPPAAHLRPGEGIMVLPADAMTLRAFLQTGSDRGGIDDRSQERLARFVHARFLDENRHRNPDAASRPWEYLTEGLQRSNSDQVGYMTQMLAACGFQVVPTADARAAATLTDDDVERLAEMEHGRWNAERIRDGWQPGERDPEKRRSPYLVPWIELDDCEPKQAVKEWDRSAVRRFPELLAAVGLKVVR